MDAVILVGGFGTRLRTVVSDVPKPMAIVCGKPFLEILLSRLVQSGINRIILSTGYKGEIIKEYFGSSFCGAEVVYSHEKVALGTGGAIYQAVKYISSDYFFVFNGDTFFDFPIGKFLSDESFKRKNVIFSKIVKENSRYGSIIEHNDKVLGFLPKSETLRENDLINAGCYFLSREVFTILKPQSNTFSFELDYLPKLIEKTDFCCYKDSGLFIDIGVPEDYALAQSLLKKYVK